jgi:hypothetical protein
VEEQIQARLRKYVKDKLGSMENICDYIPGATILCTEYDQKIIFDLLVLLENDLFRYEYEKLHPLFVDDHEHVPPVFTKIRPYQWLSNDFESRLIIALWMYRRAIILQKTGDNFDDILQVAEKKFRNNLEDIIRKKYLEFRSERHLLRACVQRKDQLAIELIKANIAKLALELSYLAESKPYPYKVRLVWEVRRDTKYGECLYRLSNEFLKSSSREVIKKSDLLVNRIIKMLLETKLFSPRFLNSWWEYLE